MHNEEPKPPAPPQMADFRFLKDSMPTLGFLIADFGVGAVRARPILYDSPSSQYVICESEGADAKKMLRR